MKNFTNKFLAVILMTAGVSYSFAQVRIVNTSANPSIANSSAFIDASSNTSTNPTTNVGKGLIFPRVDLTTFTAFNPAGPGGVGIPNNYPTRFDGMIVYNTATSGVAGIGATSQSLFAGFWYYDNKSTTVNGGTWRPIVGNGAKENILTTETVTNRMVNNAQIYGIKGTFTTTAGSTAVTIPAPAGITSMYGITIYKAGTNTVYARELYSYDTTSGAAVTGSPSMSVVYPTGTYDYVLEYLK
ncbi:hypothetical protein VUJ46_09980 [Chryseobacterium sp. MYb264]|uniref:hypothetical protein n=1 Tax=Chryseobacterium sp. MYb264 TaxID=2745153 RepID=UPI002E10E838|nr:hypothetical protein VUJ46_09980 [Chryseobacterium sp. MYb264]